MRDYRHTAISLWIAAGVDAKLVSVLAGHSSVSFTLDSYGHLYPNADQVVPSKLNAATAVAVPIRGTPIRGMASGTRTARRWVT